MDGALNVVKPVIALREISQLDEACEGRLLA